MELPFNRVQSNLYRTDLEEISSRLYMMKIILNYKQFKLIRISVTK
jgi:hypothetical protein